MQEYGRYFGMPTVLLSRRLSDRPESQRRRAAWLSELSGQDGIEGKSYTIFGYKGKQVRDQIHSLDVVRAFEAFMAAPRIGEVYNLGGGRESNASILECFTMIEAISGRKVLWRYDERNREGDHICYISDMSKFRAHYPGWSLTRRVEDIIEEMVRSDASTLAT